MHNMGCNAMKHCRTVASRNDTKSVLLNSSSMLQPLLMLIDYHNFYMVEVKILQSSC